MSPDGPLWIANYKLTHCYNITQTFKEDHCVFYWLVECSALVIDKAGNGKNKRVSEGNIKNK